jgi:hypothetical protein
MSDGALVGGQGPGRQEQQPLSAFPKKRREKGLHVFDSGRPAITGDLSRYIERDAARGQNAMLMVPRFLRRGRRIV